RALVIAAAEERLPDPAAALPDSLHDVILRENEWTAGGEGLDAELVAPARADVRVSIRSSLGELLERIAPIAASVGDADALQGIGTILARGTAADRLRDLYDRHRDLLPVTRWAVEET